MNTDESSTLRFSYRMSPELQAAVSSADSWVFDRGQVCWSSTVTLSLF